MKREDCDFTSALVDDVKGMRIGIPRDYFGEGLDPEVKDAILKAAKVLEEKGAVVEEFDLSLVEYAIPAYYVIASAEASSNLSRFDGVKYGYRTKEYEGLHNMYKKSRSEGFGPEVKAPYHAGLLRAEQRLLRCLLFKGTPYQGTHQESLRSGL